MKILVADDEEMIRELVRATLVRDGHFEVELASNGDEAIAAVRAHNPELVILDVRMPETDGVEACRRIREECGPDRPTIFMLSAMGQDSDIERGMSAGADDYLTKPFSPRELLARLYELFEIAA